jgi:hypothetical protein
MVVADDYGMNALRTDAIVAAAATGSISRASFLVNGEDAARAGVIGQAAHLPLGLHFNITEGFPLSTAAEHNNSRASSWLTRPDGQPQAGQFLGKRDLFLMLERCNDRSNPLLRQAVVDTIADELRAQLDHFVTLSGVTDVWLDGHHHVHVLEVVWEAIEEVAGWRRHERPAASFARWRIVGVRVPHDPSLMVRLPDEAAGGDADPEELRFRSEDDIFGFPFWMRVSHLASLRRKRVPPHICCPDVFVGFDIGGSDASVGAVVLKIQQSMRNFTQPRWRPQRMVDLLSARRGSKSPNTSEPISEVVIELMTHLGYDGEREDNDGISEPLFIDDSRGLRMLEWSLYSSAEFAHAMRESLNAQIV